MMVKSDRVQHGALREVLLHSLSLERNGNFNWVWSRVTKSRRASFGKRVSRVQTLGRYAGAFTGIVFFARGLSARILLVFHFAWPRAKGCHGQKAGKKRAKSGQKKGFKI
jgi:hypothetical protein